MLNVVTSVLCLNTVYITVAGSCLCCLCCLCTRASRIQAEHHDVELHAWPSSTVPDGFLLSSLQCRITAAPLIRQPMTSVRPTLPAKHHCPTGFLCGWSVGVEFLARLLAWFFSDHDTFTQHLKMFMFACMAKLYSSWWISAIQPPVSHHGSTFDLPADDFCSSHIAS